MALLRLQRFMELTTGKSLLPIANKRSRSWRKRIQRKAMRGMKKTRIIGAQGSYGSVPGGKKPAVHLPPPPRSLVLPSSVPGRGNSDQISPSHEATAHLIGVQAILAEGRGSCSRVGKKRKISRSQKAKDKLKRMKTEEKRMKTEVKRMKAEVKEQREEKDQMQAATERIESALARGRAENELLMEQNLQGQYLCMLGCIYILDGDDAPEY